MFPYWLLFALVAAPALAAPYRGDRTALGIAGLLVAAGMIAFIGLRYEVGADWFNYTEMFEYTSWMSLGEALRYGDPAYSFLNWTAAQLGVDVWLVNVICAALFTWGLFKFAFRLPNPWLTLAIATPYLIIVVAMGYTRQGVALGFILWALSRVNDVSWIRLVTLAVLAGLFHKSAFVVIPLVAIAYTRNRIVIMTLVLLMAAFVYYFLGGAIENSFTIYTENQFESQGAAIRVGMNVPPALLYLLLMRRFELSEFERRLWRNFALAALACVPVLMLTQATTVVDRFALYIIPLQLFVLSWLPSLLSGTRIQARPVVIAIVAYSALIQMVWLNYATHARDWLPYQVYPLTRDV